MHITHTRTQELCNQHMPSCCRAAIAVCQTFHVIRMQAYKQAHLLQVSISDVTHQTKIFSLAGPDSSALLEGSEATFAQPYTLASKMCMHFSQQLHPLCKQCKALHCMAAFAGKHFRYHTQDQNVQSGWARQLSSSGRARGNSTTGRAGGGDGLSEQPCCCSLPR